MKEVMPQQVANAGDVRFVFVLFFFFNKIETKTERTKPIRK